MGIGRQQVPGDFGDGNIDEPDLAECTGELVDVGQPFQPPQAADHVMHETIDGIGFRWLLDETVSDGKATSWFENAHQLAHERLSAVTQPIARALQCKSAVQLGLAKWGVCVIGVDELDTFRSKALLSTPLLLASTWAFIPALISVILLVIRTALEDRTLHAELPGYAEYASRVRFRLIPGVW